MQRFPFSSFAVQKPKNLANKKTFNISIVQPTIILRIPFDVRVNIAPNFAHADATEERVAKVSAVNSIITSDRRRPDARTAHVFVCYSATDGPNELSCTGERTKTVLHNCCEKSQHQQQQQQRQHLIKLVHIYKRVCLCGNSNSLGCVVAFRLRTQCQRKVERYSRAHTRKHRTTHA